MNKQIELINNLKEYEYFLIKVLNPLDYETHKIKFDSKKELKHIKKIISKVYFNLIDEYNSLNISYNNHYIYLKLKEVLK